VVIVLVTLIAVVGGASRYLPAVLSAIKDIFMRACALLPSIASLFVKAVQPEPMA
jgi:hypothetical protein